MAELDDELQALRNADPIDPAAMPSSSTPEAHDLFERITMSEPAATTPHRTRPWIPAAAAAILVALVGGAVAIAADDPGPSASQAASDTTSATATVPTSAGGPISPGGAASCVEFYSLESLANRDAAFDGTVESVDGDTVTFTVNRWYRGGEGEATTRRGALVLGGFTSAGPGVSIEPGSHLLVAGDEDFAWGCGFTQPFDPGIADQWAEVLSD